MLARLELYQPVVIREVGVQAVESVHAGGLQAQVVPDHDVLAGAPVVAGYAGVHLDLQTLHPRIEGREHELASQHRNADRQGQVQHFGVEDHARLVRLVVRDEPDIPGRAELETLPTDARAHARDRGVVAGRLLALEGQQRDGDEGTHEQRPVLVARAIVGQRRWLLRARPPGQEDDAGEPSQGGRTKMHRLERLPYYLESEFFDTSAERGPRFSPTRVRVARGRRGWPAFSSRSPGWPFQFSVIHSTMHRPGRPARELSGHEGQKASEATNFVGRVWKLPIETLAVRTRIGPPMYSAARGTAPASTAAPGSREAASAVRPPGFLLTQTRTRARRRSGWTRLSMKSTWSMQTVRKKRELGERFLGPRVRYRRGPGASRAAGGERGGRN